MSLLAKHTGNPLKTVFLLTLVGVFLIANSCGHAQASPSPVATAAVMKTIQDYGRDHHSLLTPGSLAKPDEPDGLYSARIKNLLVQEDFAQLEKIAQQSGIEKGRLLGGVWKTFAFYNGTGKPASAGTPIDSDYAAQIARVKKWIAAYPDSPTPRISLAYLYLNYSWLARGSGLANSVSESQWSLFKSRNAQAKAILLEAGALKEKDPYWYEAMQLVAHDEGWDQADVRELFDQAVAFEPEYYHYYREYARYVSPQWYGERGDILAFAEETSNRIPEPNGSMLYFQIVSSLACYCKPDFEDLHQISYPIAKQGYANITRFYGTSNLNANRFAFMATTFEDQPSAHEAFAAISSMDMEFGMRKALSTILVTGPMLTRRAGDVAGEGFAKTRGSRVNVKCF
jgi:hypothetical protein